MSSSNKSTLKRHNTDDLQASPKRQKSEENEEEDDVAEENREVWIQEQLNALQVKANQSYVNIDHFFHL
jgi:hypothetical protein